jgi:deoxyribonuclease (pyrimidine dimer)
MTRINLVDPEELMDQHLIAEYREIRLLCANLQRTINSKCGFQQSKVPADFTLNKSHCYFFYNKGQYIHKRYDALRREMINRGFDPQHDFPREKWPDELYNDWAPSEDDKNIVRERISQRISERPNWYRYRGQLVDPR